jgi:hypothetical protein
MKCRVDIGQLGRWVIWDVLLSALVFPGDSRLALYPFEDVEVTCTVVLV